MTAADLDRIEDRLRAEGIEILDDDAARWFTEGWTSALAMVREVTR